MSKVTPTSIKPVYHQQGVSVCKSGSKAWTVDTMSPPWDHQDCHAFPTAAIQGKDEQNLRDHAYMRIILIVRYGLLLGLVNVSPDTSMPAASVKSVNSSVQYRTPQKAGQFDAMPYKLSWLSAI